MGNVRGASGNWRTLATGGTAVAAGGAMSMAVPRVDLLAGQRSQLKEFGRSGTQDRPQDPRLNESFGSNHSGSETYGSREASAGAAGSTAGRSTNAMEINKIAQCSKMVPGMSGSEIRSALTAVNWDTVNITVEKRIKD